MPVVSPPDAAANDCSQQPRCPMLLRSTRCRLPSLPKPTIKCGGTNTAPPAPRSVSPLFKVAQLDGVKKSRTDRLLLTLTYDSPKLELPSQLPLPVMK